MQLSLLRIQRLRIIVTLLALAICAGTAQAANVLVATPSTVTLTCSTVTGPGTATVVITTAAKPTASLAVSLGALPTGITVTPTTGTLTGTNYATGITFTLGMTAATGGATAGCATYPVSGTFNFKQGASNTTDVLITVNTALNSTTSGLVVSPAAVNLTCVKTGSTYTPGAAQSVSVTSAATNGGTPFTMTGATVPAWLTTTPVPGNITGPANATPISFTVAPTATAGATPGCGGFSAPSTNFATIHLADAPGPDKTVAVTMQVVSPSTLTVTPTPSSGALTYVKGSGTPGYVDVAVAAPNVTPAPFFAVDTTTLPIWLNVDSTSGTAPKSIRFSSNSVADTLAPGNYSASVNLNVSGYAPLPINLSLLVTNAAPKLTVKEGAIQNITWVLGQAIPNPTITLVSSDSPISYSLATGGTLAPVITASEQNGLAYSFGTPIPITFNQTAFAAAAPGNTLTGTVTITWGPNASTTVVTFNVTVTSPGATLTGISPASIPTATSGGPAATVVLSGTGFVTGTDPTVRTNVGIIANAQSTMSTDTNIAINVSSSSIVLTITVPATADPLLPFTAGGNVTLGVCNPIPGANATCTTPSATMVLTIGSAPIISAVTSASKFQEVSGTTLQQIAPFDLISIFGSNFCPPCSSNQILQATPDANTKVYPSTLSPDPTSATQRNLQIAFYQHGSATSLGTAPLLFATNNQINLAVPSGISAQVGNNGGVDIVVSFGYGAANSATLKSSSAYRVTAVATNPGIFTIGADGQGEGAALDHTWATIGQTNPAGMRSTATDSDTIQVFMTGLGAPDSTATDATGGANAYAADCISPSNFLAALNNQASSSLIVIDGAIIQGSLIDSSRMPPCIATTNVPTATVGGQAATVSYAGWVADSIAGLYQVNFKLPASVLGSGTFTTSTGATPTSITAPIQLPVTVTAGTQSSQANVLLWVAPRLKVVAPTGGALTGNIGASWPVSTVTATEGTPNYQYLVTSGVLPSGLALNSATGAISGVPALNTVGSYLVTVTAIDSATPAVSGSATFTLVVGGGLVLSGVSAPITVPSLTLNANVATVTAAGGVSPYTYSISATPSTPAGLTINAVTGVIGVTASTPAGNYVVTVSAHDATTGTQLIGALVFSLNVSLNMSVAGNGSTISEGGGGGVVTVTAASGTSPYTYALTSPSSIPADWAFSTANGTITITAGAAHAATAVVVTATDATASTPLTGTIGFTVTVGP